MATFCSGRPEVCDAGVEAFSLAREAGLYVAERAVDLLADNQPAS